MLSIKRIRYKKIVWEIVIFLITNFHQDLSFKFTRSVNASAFPFSIQPDKSQMQNVFIHAGQICAPQGTKNISSSFVQLKHHFSHYSSYPKVHLAHKLHTQIFFACERLRTLWRDTVLQHVSERIHRKNFNPSGSAVNFFVRVFIQDFGKKSTWLLIFNSESKQFPVMFPLF